MVKNSLLVILIIFFSVSHAINCAIAEDIENNVITVFVNSEVGQVNKRVLGNNFLLSNLMGSYDYSRADYGAGIWNPKKNESVKEVIELAKNAGVSIIRFYTGNYFNWKDTIGKKRKQFLFGMDEFLKTVKEIGAEPLFMISYFTGNEQDAADLVEYLNAPCDGKHPWAEERAKNGHPGPYGVKYFELGDELFVWGIKNPKEYATKYLLYQEVMKKVDPSVQLGLGFGEEWWNSLALDKAGNKVDFVVLHIYPPHDMNIYSLHKELKAEELYKVALGSPIVYSEKFIDNVLKLIEKNTGRNDVYIAVTEFNGYIGGEGETVPYRHSLGTALITAELLRIFMKPEHKIQVANYWHFSNDYFGMIRSEDDYIKHNYQKPINYIKRPNYYVFELYDKHFGEVMIEIKVKSGAYDISEYEPYMRKFIKTMLERIGGGNTVKKNLLGEKWQILNFLGVNVKAKDGLLELDFENPENFNYYGSIKRAKVQSHTYYKLSGYIRTEELIDKEGVCFEIVDSRGWDKTQSAAATPKITGTADWQHVEVVYKTLSDATSVDVIARRIGNKGPLKGKAFFKDVKLEQYIPPDTHIPYLSVNASKSTKGDKIYLMIINKNMEEAITSSIEIKDFLPSDKADAWTLNGPSVDATNEKKADNVKVTHREFEIKNNSFVFTFEPHSLISIEIAKKE